MQVNIDKIISLFEDEEERRFLENQTHPESMLIGKQENKFKKHHKVFIDKVKSHQFGKTTDSGENLDAMEKYNISEDEASLVYMYTIDMCFEINEQLRTRKTNLDKDIEEYSNQLNYVLSKLPAYEKSTYGSALLVFFYY